MTAWKPELDGHVGPMYEQIAKALEADIRSGQLSPGTRLPTHRDLAATLGVTVGTVSRAFGEVLRLGLIDTGPRRGSRVIDRPGDVASGPRDTRVNEGDAFAHDLRGHRSPLPDWDNVVRAALTEAMAGPGFTAALGYSSGPGRITNREAGAQWLATNLPSGAAPHPEHVIVCNGAQHALFCALLLACEAGDAVATERLTYTGLKTIAPTLGLTLHGVESDRYGIVPEALGALLKAHPIRALVLTPHLQNPTTATVPVERREAIAALADEHGVAVIEDDVFAPLCRQALSPIGTLVPERAYRLSGVSKALGPGLKVGFLQVPAGTSERAAATLRATSWMASPISVELVTHLITSGTAAQIVRRNRKAIERRNAVAREALADLKTWQDPCGPYLWLELPEPWTRESFTNWSRRAGIAALTAEHFAVGRRHMEHAIRITVTGPADAGALAAVLSTLAETLAGPPPRAETMA